MELKDVVAKNLVELRKLYSYTQAELAEKLNYSDKAGSKWERGESLPDVETLKKIADIYNVSVDYILSENVEVKPKQARKALVAGQKIIITLLSTLLVWIVATAVFVLLCGLGLSTHDAAFSFIAALPASFIVLIVFDSIWGKSWLNMIFVSGLLWTLALTVYLAIGSAQAWLCFIIPIPLQIGVLLWFGLHVFNQRLKKKD